MASFGLDASGGLDDAVRLEIAGEEVLIAEAYEFAMSAIDVPSAFTVRVGHGGIARELIERFPPHSKVRLFVGDVLQASGRLDGFSLAGSDGTSLDLHGRDNLAPLHDAFIREEKSYASATYLDIVQIALAESGVDPGGVVYTTNAANRATMSGVEANAREPRNVDEIVVEKGKGGAVYKTVQARLSERWLDFVRTHLDRAGLFLWPMANGDWVLSAPNVDQPPLYRLELNAELPSDGGGFRGGVRRDTYRNGVQPPRYSEVIVYSRVGSKKFGRGKVKGKWTDDELLVLGIDRPLTMRDANVASVEQAERLAQRKLADGRRATFELVYTTHGHTAASLVGGDRAVWCIDTMVELDDREAGLKGNFYIESVTHRRSDEGGTTTSMRLLRPADAVFGSDEVDETAEEQSARLKREEARRKREEFERELALFNDGGR